MTECSPVSSRIRASSWALKASTKRLPTSCASAIAPPRFGGAVATNLQRSRPGAQIGSPAMIPPELVDFAEAMGVFLEPAPGRLLRVGERYVLSADFGQTWAQVERIRLREDELADAIAEVD